MRRWWKQLARPHPGYRWTTLLFVVVLGYMAWAGYWFLSDNHFFDR